MSTLLMSNFVSPVANKSVGSRVRWLVGIAG